jgi:SAM-dependent methyltransferase
VNVDASFGAKLAKLSLLRPLLRTLGVFRLDWSPDILIHDLRRPFPWPSASARAIYSSHTLEHLTSAQGERFLLECARVLAPGGVLRIVVPDLASVLSDYEKGVFPATELVDRLGVGFEHPRDGWLKAQLAPFFRHPHRCMYDAESLLDALGAAGLDARVHAPFLSRIGDLRDLELPERAEGSLIVEGVKRG